MASIMYGYARVSTQVQNEARQLAALRDFGVAEENIIIEKQSGKDFNRPRYRWLVEKLHIGDVLVTQSIDRLGRNYNEILDQWRLITKERKAAIVVLDMPLLDTRKCGNDLTGRFIDDLVLQILSYVAETERRNIRQRQAEGIAAAKARGVRFGKPVIPMPDNFPELYKEWEAERISIGELAELCNMGRSTMYKRIGEYRARLYREGGSRS